jgi:sugar O-acyltransferase (sialic acid O-acetyltransferase NeuD family)
VADLVTGAGVYTVAGFVDDLTSEPTVLGLPILGGSADLGELAATVGLAANGVGGIARVEDRVESFERLVAAGFSFPTLVHRAGVVEPSAELAPGVQIFAGSFVGPLVRLGFGTIVNTAAVVSHDCVLGDYVNLSPGALLAGNVEVGDRTLIGMGATVNLGLRVGASVRIGNSAVVKADVPDGTVVHAGALWPPRRG